MIRLTRFVASFSLFLFFFAAISGQTNIDSLKSLIPDRQGEEKAKLLYTISSAYWNTCPDSGIFYGNLSLELSEDLNYSLGIAQSYNAIGVNNWALGDLDSSFSCFSKAVEAFETIGEIRYTAVMLNNMGLVMTSLNKYDIALDYYVESFEIKEDLRDSIGMANALNNIGVSYENLSNFQDAIKSHLMAYNLHTKLNNIYGISTSLHNIGINYTNEGNNEKAIEYYLKSIEIKKKLNDKNGIARLLVYIGIAYQDLHDFENAISYLKKGESLAAELQSKELMLSAKHSLFVYYEVLGKDKEALAYYKLYDQLKDSIFSEESISKISELEVKYESEKKQKENELLHKNNEIQLLQITKQTTIRNLFIAISILAGILLILFYSRLIIKRRANLALKEKNKIITDQKNYLSQAHHELEELNATKDKFFSIIAHDLKSPFNSLLGFSEILSKDYDKYSDEKRKKFISYMSRSIKNSFYLLENLLLWASNQKEGIIIKKEDLNLRLITDQSSESFMTAAFNKQLKIINLVSSEIDIHADKFSLLTIIGNLINNAIKFTPEDGEITVNAILESKILKVEIKDTGMGMDKNTIDSLFKLGKKQSLPGTNEERGTGLGLIICKDIIEENKGKIWAESSPGKGSSFYFTIPI